MPHLSYGEYQEFLGTLDTIVHSFRLPRRGKKQLVKGEQRKRVLTADDALPIVHYMANQFGIDRLDIPNYSVPMACKLLQGLRRIAVFFYMCENFDKGYEAPKSVEKYFPSFFESYNNPVRLSLEDDVPDLLDGTITLAMVFTCALWATENYPTVEERAKMSRKLGKAKQISFMRLDRLKNRDRLSYTFTILKDHLFLVHTFKVPLALEDSMDVDLTDDEEEEDDDSLSGAFGNLQI